VPLYAFSFLVGLRTYQHHCNRKNLQKYYLQHRLGCRYFSTFFFTNLIIDVVHVSIKIAKCCAGDKIEKIEMSGACSGYGEVRGVYRVLVGKPEGKRPLGRPRRRWEDNVRMDLQEMGCGCEDWIGLAQDRDTWLALVSAVRNLGVP
jgi:hypothetical protein